jgi:hypothetical protein
MKKSPMLKTFINCKDIGLNPFSLFIQEFSLRRVYLDIYDHSGTITRRDKWRGGVYGEVRLDEQKNWR